ncbi:ABC transporter transmembrane domain-containing protein [Hyphomonas sp.]|uniref:ABC transporter transmembrane domain-containing protein n=1 Tax=Hyphomonas sp. TaxID=87 RepID=UPI0026061AED|nr:ABC transporter transmembrane domain-containing protein [Hyphomonas sp.]MDF1807276.1 ABC transporter transmembrane domain-containing protein [Hyphomonas sp.]
MSNASSIPKPHRFRLDIVAVSLVMHLLGLALPLAMLQVYDRILPAQSYGTATVLVAGVALAITLEMLLRYGRQSLFINIGARYEALATIAVLERLQHADVNRVEQLGTSSVSDALQSIVQIRDFWSGQAGAALYELPFVAVYLGLIYYIGGWLVIFPLSLFIVALVLALGWSSAIRRLNEEADKASRLRQDFNWRLFSSLDFLKATGTESGMLPKWRYLNAAFLSLSAAVETRSGWIRENAASIGQLSTVLIVAFGASEVIGGQLTTGSLAACTLLAGRSIGPAMASLGYIAQFARTRATQRQIDEIIGLPDNPALGAESQSGGMQVGEGRIEIEAPDLLGAPAAIEPGEIVHIGSLSLPLSSHLLTAVSGLGEIDGVTVRIDGRPLTDFPADSFRAAVMLVPRHLALVPGSILNNLTLYDPRYNQHVDYFCDRLGLQSHLDKLRNGVLTEVGPGTAEQLDEGIYQRIAIIRALLRRPRILLLDHAASGIDIDGIRRLAVLLKELGGNTTVLIATNRQQLIEACDRSLVLKGLEAET